MRSIFVVLVSALSLSAVCAGEPRTVAELTRAGPDGVAIDGYSPVAYFTERAARKGSPEHTASFEGATYRFTSAEERDLFRADPKKYAPAHGGWCSLMLTGSGNLTPADPESFKIVDGRLLLFWGGDYKGQQISGLRNWESKFADPDGEQKLLKKADRTWAALLSGKKKENVVFFSPGDAERVSAGRKAAGKNQYD